MPIYEYQCEQCAHRMEALQKISDDPLKECPECNQASLKKLVSAASFRLKGGGWYETDFKTGDKKQLADSDSDNKGSKNTATDDKSGNVKSDSNKSKSGDTKVESKSKKSDSASQSSKSAS